MALRSMTGFARDSGEAGAFSWHWEVRSVNGKGFDVRLRLPPGFDTLEKSARELAARHIGRGNCQMNLVLRRMEGAGELRVNAQALEQALKAMQQVSDAIKTSPPRPEGVLALKGVLESVEPEPSEKETAARDAAILKSLDKALAGLDAMRRDEGGKMQKILAGQIDEIEELTIKAGACPAISAEAITQRLAEQVARLLEASAELDEARLHQEAALLGAKADIREELDRLGAHVSAARKLLDGKGPVGRELDFLSQEFNREANTLCSKSNDSDLTALGLKLKTVIGQMREQVQNIE